MNPLLRRRSFPVLALLSVAGAPFAAFAQEAAPALEERLAKVEAAAAGAQGAGDN